MQPDGSEPEPEPDAALEDAATDDAALDDAATEDAAIEDAAVPDPDASVEPDASTDAGDPMDPDAEVESCAPASPSVSVGSSTDPFAIQLDTLPHEASVDPVQPSYFRISGVVPNTPYELILKGSDQLRLLAFGMDASFTNAVCAYGPDSSPLPARCPVTVAGTDLYVVVTAASHAEAFTLELVERVHEGVDEGSLSEPIQVALAELPFTGEVDGFEFNSVGSYYEITGLTPYQWYAVSVAFDSGERSSIVLLDGLDAPVGLDNGNDVSIARPTTSSLIVYVSGSLQGTSLTLDIGAPESTSEGTREAPVVIDYALDLPFDGTIGWATNPFWADAESDYVVTGLEPGSYVVTLSSGAVVDLGVYDDDASYNQVECSAVTAADVPGECFARTSSGDLYLRVSNRQGLGGPIVLDVEPASNLAEGTASEPTALALTSLPRASTVEPDVASVYRITGLTPGELYAVLVKDTDHPLTVVTRPDPLSAELCSLATSEGKAPACSFVAPAASVDVEVYDVAFGGIGTSFTLDIVVSTLRSEGTEAEPVEIPCTGSAYEGTVDPSAGSYYEVTGLIPGTAYLIALESRGAELGLWSAPDGACTLSIDASGGGRCFLIATAETQSLVVGSGYQTAFDLTISEAAHVSQGAIDAPLAVPVASLPYNGEVNGTSPSYYRITGLDPDVTYFAVISGTGSGYLVADTGLLEPGVLNPDGSGEQGAHAPLGYPDRIAVSGSSTLDLTVVAYDSPFTIAIEEAPYESEGSVDEPRVLPLAELPHTGSVDGSRPSAYTITGLEAGVAYRATLEPLEGLPYLQLNSTSTLCSALPLWRGAFVATSTSTTLYALTSRVGSGPFVLDVEPVVQPEGTVDMPIEVALAELPYGGETSCAARNHYAVTGLTAGTTYLVTASTTSGAPVSLIVDSVADLSSPTRCTGARCEITATGAALYISAGSTDDAGSSFQLDVEPAGYASEGTMGMGLALALSSLPHSGSVAKLNRSFYRITGLTPAVPYDVTIANALIQTQLSVRDGATSQTLCDTRPPRRVPDYGMSPRCIATPTGSTLDVEVIGNLTSGTTFELDVFHPQ